MDEGDRGAEDVIRRAISMELEGKEFFERASGMMTRKRSREMFMGLAAQEGKHVEVLSRELSRLEDGLGWESLEEARRQSGKRSGSPVFSKRGAGVIRIAADAGELEVVDLGIEVEKRSIEYYRDAGRNSKDEAARQVFDWLVGEESGHLTILQAERDSRSGSGFHYDSAEFSLETQ